jgi:cytochrome c-type biogenesis protein CcmE
MMTRKRKRLIFVLAGLVLLGSATWLTLSALQDNLVFFYSPTDIYTKGVTAGRLLRLGGLVASGSIKRESDGKTIDFTVTDGKNSIPVIYAGDLPDLFREGQGVVVEGRLQADGNFSASTVLAKHDEKYMPPEVVDALKRAGRWQEGMGSSGGPAALTPVKTPLGNSQP